MRKIAHIQQPNCQPNQQPTESNRIQTQGRDVSLFPRNEQELVDYEGMLVSGAAAQRRG
jgi:hypothetical protein